VQSDVQATLVVSRRKRDSRSRSVAQCPRCGYDLRGTVESWKESCPLDGVCTECGLAFEWAELISDKIRKPSWSQEFCPRRALPHRVATTVARSYLPWKFWRELKMSHPIRPSRLAAYAIAMVLLIVVLLYASHALHVWNYWRDFVSRSATAPVTPYVTMVEPLLRPFAHESVIARNPKRWRSIGWSDYPTPREQLIAHFKPGVASIMLPMSAGILTMALLPMTFALLPVSRKRARVRWAHIARISCYSASLFLALATVALLAEAPHESREYFFHRIQESFPAPGWYRPLALYGVPLAVVGWWFFAIRSYLRMSEPALLTLAVGLLAIFAAHAGYLVLDMVIFL